MLVSTARYSDRGSRELAQAFALCTGSAYSARGKKTVEKLVSDARKRGENTLTLVSENEISFISISHSGWEWKTPVLRIRGYKILGVEESEIGTFEGADSSVFEALFGFEPYYSGETVVSAGNGKLKFINEDKEMLEIDYEVKHEKPSGDGS